MFSKQVSGPIGALLNHIAESLEAALQDIALTPDADCKLILQGVTRAIRLLDIARGALKLAEIYVAYERLGLLILLYAQPNRLRDMLLDMRSRIRDLLEELDLILKSDPDNAERLTTYLEISLRGHNTWHRVVIHELGYQYSFAGPFYAEVALGWLFGIGMLGRYGFKPPPSKPFGSAEEPPQAGQKGSPGSGPEQGGTRSGEDLPRTTGRSLGAASRPYYLEDSEFYIREGQDFSTSRRIATGSDIRVVDRLLAEHGGTRAGWKKMSNVFEIQSERPPFQVRSEEIHWYEHEGIGRFKFKIKED